MIGVEPGSLRLARQGTSPRLPIWQRLLEPVTTASGISLTAVVFLLGLAVRLAYFAANPRLTTLCSICGVPYSDAVLWDALAGQIAQGHGFTGTVSSFRPLFAIFLAFVYTWFGHSFTAGTLANIVVGSFAPALAFAVTDRVAGRVTAIATSASLLVGLPYLQEAMYLKTEMLGLTLFVLSCLVLTLGLERGDGELFLAGVTFSLCNLTRTLSLPVLPVYLVLAFAFRYRRLRLFVPALRGPAALLFGCVLTLAPWLVRQKLVTGIASISTNSADVLFTATSPVHGNWLETIKDPTWKDLPRAPAERSRVLNARTLENLRNHPGFYARNVARSAVEFASYYGEFVHLGTTTLALGILLLLETARALRRKVGGALGHLAPLALAAVLLAVHLVLPGRFAFAVAVAGAGLAFRLRPDRLSIALSMTLAATGLASSMVAHAGVLGRLFIMVAWLFDVFYFFAVSMTFRAAFQRLAADRRTFSLPVEPDPPVQLAPSRFECRVRKVTAWGLVAFGLFVLASSTRIVFRTVGHRPDPPLAVTDERKAGILQAVNAAHPGAIDAEELADREVFSLSVGVHQPATSDGRLIGEVITIDPYLYLLGAEPMHHWIRFFADRGYARSVFSSRMGIVAGEHRYFLFPAWLSQSVVNRTALVVGRLNVDEDSPFEARQFLELMAMEFLDGAGESRLLVASDAAHWARLDELRYRRKHPLPSLLEVRPGRTLAGSRFGEYKIGEKVVSTLYARTRDATRESVLYWGETALPTAFGGPDWVTATVPDSLYSAPSEVPIRLRDGKTFGSSAPVIFHVESNTTR